MSRAPLEALALFAAAPPADAVSACAVPGGPLVRVALVERPVLPPWLDDPEQPLDDDERAAARRSGVALLLSCDDAPAPIARLAGFAEIVTRVLALGGSVALLPAALRAIGASRLGGPWSPAALTAAFVHRHRVREAGDLWCHTHGLEQLDLPDLECRAPAAELERAERLLDAAVVQLAERGAPFTSGERVTLGDGPQALRFLVAASRARDHHSFGARGALELFFTT